MTDRIPIQRALLSVSDKFGLIELARVLHSRSVQMLASGGTFRALVDAGIPVKDVATHTGQPEILGGRVKTLHAKIHGGILARRELPEDQGALREHGIDAIDLVVVNLYPFRETVARPDCSLEDAIENIDIGGPTLIRSAAKNHAHVAVATAPEQYAEIAAQLAEHGGTTLELRRKLAVAAFEHTSAYDAAILGYLQRAYEPDSDVFPRVLDLRLTRRQTLRYGENPHQRGAFYDEPDHQGANLASARILHGKELSYNNLLDLDSALRLIRLFREPAAVILKHNNPCGAAESADLAGAFERAYEGDPVSAFGGIVGLNRAVDLATARLMGQSGRFIECVVAPGYDPDALEFLTTKPTWKSSVRLLAVEPSDATPSGFDLRRVEGGLLVQDWDTLQCDQAEWSTVTRRPPTASELADLAFAWRVCGAVKSNAIVIAGNKQVLGVGAGQMSRLDSVRIALEKAGDRAGGAVLASDAFFPFRDGPDLAIAAGVTAFVQPGGSKRDEESISACDEGGVAMVFTGRRHFRH